MKLTMPQIIMLNAGAEVNRQRLDRRIAKGRQSGYATIEDKMADEPMWNGKRVSELTSAEYVQYQRASLE